MTTHQMAIDIQAILIIVQTSSSNPWH